MYLKMMNDKSFSIKKIGDKISKTHWNNENTYFYSKAELKALLSKTKEENYDVYLIDHCKNKIFDEKVEVIILESEKMKYVFAEKYCQYDRVYLLDDEGQTLERLI